MVLTIKGARGDALAAAQSRAIAVLEVLNESADPWTVVRTGDDAENVERVARWFTEPVASQAGQGFPSGALLLYYW
jgi:hypothetical protein